MTARESRLAVLILGFVGVAAVAFFGYQFYYVPMQAKTKRIASLSEEIEKQATKLKTVRDSQPRLKALTAISLPADPTIARKEYEDEMSKLLRKSGLESVTVMPKDPDTRTVPSFSKGKPIYTKLLFTVSAKGDLASVVDWLERFYKLRLLHQIRNLSLSQAQRADTRGDRAERGELDVNATIEAIILDKAEARKSLLPEKMPELPSLLAQPERQYASIGGKNIFYGARPEPTIQGESPGIDPTPFMKVDSITIGPNGPVATLFDVYHNHDYQIKVRALGGYRVEVFYYIPGRGKRSLRSDKDLVLYDDQGQNERHRWAIVRIDDRELILRDDAKGYYYSVHVGQTLAEMHQLTKEELAALGIKEEPKKEQPPAEEP